MTAPDEFWCDVCHSGFYAVPPTAVCPSCGEDVLDVTAPDLDGVDLPMPASESFD